MRDVVVLVVAVTVTAAISLATLFLTISLARQMRRLPGYADAAPGDFLDDAIGLQQGERFPPVEAIAVDGSTVDSSFVGAGRVLVGFFVANCPGCRNAVTNLTSPSEELRARPLGVVAGNPRAAARLIEQLASAGVPTVAGSDADHLAAACRVDLFPTFTLFDDGHVVGTGLGETGTTSLEER